MMAKGRSVATKPVAASRITHHGMVSFDFATGLYARASGTSNWIVRPIDWPGVPGPPPVGQVVIQFDEAIEGPYTVLVSACRTADAPMLAANYGDLTAAGFVVIVFNPVALSSYQTVRNGNFSFVVIQ
jgi:hypothetical protein